MSSTLTIWSRDNLEDNTCRYYIWSLCISLFWVWTSTEWRGLYEGPSPNFLRYARVQPFVAHTVFALACFHMAPIACAQKDVSRDFKFTWYNLPLYLYTAEIMWTLWYIAVTWLVHMCKQGIGMWKVITRTNQGSWSRRGELCYQLYTAIPMTQPSFWGYQIFMKIKF